MRRFTNYGANFVGVDETERGGDVEEDEILLRGKEFH